MTTTLVKTTVIAYSPLPVLLHCMHTPSAYAMRITRFRTVLPKKEQRSLVKVIITRQVRFWEHVSQVKSMMFHGRRLFTASMPIS